MSFWLTQIFWMKWERCWGPLKGGKWWHVTSQRDVWYHWEAHICKKGFLLKKVVVTFKRIISQSFFTLNLDRLHLMKLYWTCKTIFTKQFNWFQLIIKPATVAERLNTKPFFVFQMFLQISIKFIHVIKLFLEFFERVNTL